MKKIIILLLSFISCSQMKRPTKTCQYEVTQLKTIVEAITDVDLTVELYVLADNLTANCNDSTQIMSLINGYLSTIHKEYKVTGVFLYSDSSKFDKGEPLCQNWSEVNKHCIVGINLDEYLNPVDFYFYDHHGKQCYKGQLWKPCR